jgi:hypothetical protein
MGLDASNEIRLEIRLNYKHQKNILNYRELKYHMTVHHSIKHLLRMDIYNSKKIRGVVMVESKRATVH